MKSVLDWFGTGVLALGFQAAVVSGSAAPVSTNQFHFRMPHSVIFEISPNTNASPSTKALNSSVGRQWLDAIESGHGTNVTRLGSRVVVQIQDANTLSALLKGHTLTFSRQVSSNVFVLQAPDALTAAQEADRLASVPGVRASYPVPRRPANLNNAYARRSNDPFFVPYFNLNPSYDAEWYLENRGYDGQRSGVDLNVLAAWPYATGAGVTVAIADSGLQLDHPELAPRVAGAPHFNFYNLTTNAVPFGGYNGEPKQQREIWTHATSIGGLIAAEGGNGVGMAGVAPQAHLASWVIFDPTGSLISDEALMDMYQYASNSVDVENHSWGAGNNFIGQGGPTLLEMLGIKNAVLFGRHGLGTVIVRSAGNDRALQASADDDGYPDDPDVIAVGAVTKTGQVTDYSEPGACLLLAAPGGDENMQGLFTLDLVGADRGVNAGINFFQPDLSNYRWGGTNDFDGFVGTSAAAPLVSGVAALVLSANPNLGYRDVQQILLLSAHQGDPADPAIVTNGAGLIVCNNEGFGIPDAGEAVRLARLWSDRPPVTTFKIQDDTLRLIPDEGLRVEVSGAGTPAELASIQCAPDLGRFADDPTAGLPLVDIGLATNVPAMDLSNKGALIERGTNLFADKIANAAQAGAAFAIIYNYSTNVNPTGGGDQLLPAMGQTERANIPAVFIGNSDGEALKALFETNDAARARIHLSSADVTIHAGPVEGGQELLCEHVGIEVRTDHPSRKDVRITLLSPSGTRSVLQTVNYDTNAGPSDWTYWTTHDFFEPSGGDWKISVSDTSPGATGSVLSVSLVIRGVPINDADHDGLDDAWELSRLGTMAYVAKDDPDGDGFSNAREQVMGTNPLASDRPFKTDLSWWELAGYRRSRLSWPGTENTTYQIYSGTNMNSLELITNIPGAFPETEWLGPYESAPGERFFKVDARPAP